MKIKDLIRELECFDGDLPVKVKNDSSEVESPIKSVEWVCSGMWEEYCNIITSGE